MSEEQQAPEGCDAADLPQASMVDHPADHLMETYCPKCDHAVEAVCPKCQGHVEPGWSGPAGYLAKDNAASSRLTPGDFYRRFATMLQNQRNSKFTLGCYLIATGDAYADGVSMTEFGERWGVTKAAVSKHCRLICAFLGIQPSQYMRREATAAKFRGSNRRPVKHEVQSPKSKVLSRKKAQ